MFSRKPTNFQANIMAFCALILAAAAFVDSLFPMTATVFGAAFTQSEPNSAGNNPSTVNTDQPVQAAAANAVINRTFNYQGVLRKPDGKLAANGEYAMTFKIYDAVIGGNLLHTESKAKVPVRDGIFNVILGDDVAIGSNVFANVPRFLGIAVAPDPEMAPRQRIHPVPWALIANTLVPDPSVEGSLRASRALFSGDPGRQIEVNAYGGAAADIRANLDLHINALGQNLFVNTQGSNIYMGSGNSTVDINGSLSVHGARPILLKRYRNVGDGADFDTGISGSNYWCTTGGFTLGVYDINENGANLNRILTYWRADTNTWWVNIQFSSHGVHENPTFDLVCFRLELVQDLSVVNSTAEGTLQTEDRTSTNGQ